MIKITFSDNGCGMDRKMLGRLFEPFYTTKEKGTGLGLSISKRIIDGHKGRIHIESRKGKGTKVHIFLPSDPL